MGLRNVVSVSDLRAMSSAATAARCVAWAAARFDADVSSAVADMKPWLTSAWLLPSARCAMATWAAAAFDCSSACCTRA